LTNYEILSIGHVEKVADNHRLIINNEYEDGLYRLNMISHVYVLWWIHGNDSPEARKAKRVIPRVRESNVPPQEMGTFSTRSPRRPNPIGLTLVKILSIEGCKITVDFIDAFDGSPIIDIKPFLPNGDCVENVELPPWFNHLKTPRKGDLSQQ